MNISSAKTSYSIAASATPSRAGSFGTTNLGGSGKGDFTDSDQVYQTHIVLAGAANASLDLTTGAASGDAWTPPTRQVETTTAVGTVTTAGNATVTVTAAGLTGSPLAISVPVLLDDTPALVGSRIRTALNNNSDITALFEVSGTNDSIVLTRNALATYTLGTTVIAMAHPDDATLNIAIANDTSVGITPDADSTNTTPGVAAAGAYITNNDVDFEGFSLDSPSAIYALLIDHSTTDDAGQTLDYVIGTEYAGRLAASVGANSAVLLNRPDSASILDTLTLVASGETGLVKVTAVNKV